LNRFRLRRGYGGQETVEALKRFGARPGAPCLQRRRGKSCGANGAMSLSSVGQRSRNSIAHHEPALKARFNPVRFPEADRDNHRPALPAPQEPEFTEVLFKL